MGFADSNCPILSCSIIEDALASFELPTDGGEPAILVTEDDASPARMAL
jgi:hypothetical protein